MKQPRTSQPHFEIIILKRHPAKNAIRQDEFLPLRVCLVAWFSRLTQDYAHSVHAAGRYHICLRLLGRTGASGWLPARF